MTHSAREYNFDGLVGPTHNYSGLSFGNIASMAHQQSMSNPKEAALQGLLKMKVLADMGLGQAVLPPQERPDIYTLRSLGFQGTDADVLSQVKKVSPDLLSVVSSASCMWTANAATVAPSADASDGKVHFTPANLISKLHRALEPEATSQILKVIFKDPNYFTHHPPLPSNEKFGDEGAANHTRLCENYGDSAVEFFVFGRRAFPIGDPEPKKFPARQTFEASSAIIRRHRLQSDRVVICQQNPDMIDAGVFHNDVASVGNQNVLFYHEAAFYQSEKVIEELRSRYLKLTQNELKTICVPTSAVSVNEAVKSYLFNSQLVTLPDGGMALIAPSECNEIPAVKNYLSHLLNSSQCPIRDVETLDLRQSMRNGGGPACLRLRVVLTEKEKNATLPTVFMTDSLYKQLSQWVQKHYRDRLAIEDLADPKLLMESRTALDELTQILKLGSLYPFQKPTVA